VIRGRVHWAVVALIAVLAVGLALWATGRLQLNWRAPNTVATAKDEHGHEGKREEGHGDEESRVRGDKAILDTEAIKAAGLTSQPVRTGSVGVTVEAPGEVRVPDQSLAHVTPRVSGVVREIYKARGEMVAVGAALAVIESAEVGDARASYDAAVRDVMVAEANLEAWRRNAQANGGGTGAQSAWLELDQALGERQAAGTEQAVAERASARMKELHDRGLRSGTELLAVEADLARAQARADAAQRRIAVLGVVADTELKRARQRLDAAQAKLRALGGDAGAAASGGSARVVVRSPIAGVVTERDLTVGQTVEAAAKIFSIADLTEVWVTAALYDKDLTAVRQGQPATVRVQGLGDAVWKGRVIQVGPQVDEKTRTLAVRIAVPNQARANGLALRPGMFATVTVEVSRKPDALVVPVSAVQSLNGQPVVFVETPLSEGAAYQRRAVKVGARDGDVIEVVEGLTAGDRVVVANAYLLKSEFERSKIIHGHAH
jgi:cobalt-zinc-cadmium efflux system membrane fusion protein